MKLESTFPLFVSASDVADIKWILHARPRHIRRGTTVHRQNSAEEAKTLRAVTEAIIFKACKDVLLSGISGLTSCHLSKDEVTVLENGDFVRKDMWVLDTHGGTLDRVLCLDELCSELCMSNDVHSVFNTLGIEAALAVLFDQIKMTLQFDGSYTNDRHLSLLCNFCTSQGALLPISRHGINRSADCGALSRASFEEVTDQLLEASLYGDSDYTSAFSPSIMVGQRAINVGTGTCYVLHEEEEQASDSGSDDVVFTSVDADVNTTLSYFHVMTQMETPFADGDYGPLPNVLRHSYLAPSASTQNYIPSSPKICFGHRNENTNPRLPKMNTRVIPFLEHFELLIEGHF